MRVLPALLLLMSLAGCDRVEDFWDRGAIARLAVLKRELADERAQLAELDMKVRTDVPRMKADLAETDRLIRDARSRGIQGAAIDRLAQKQLAAQAALEGAEHGLPTMRAGFVKAYNEKVAEARRLSADVRPPYRVEAEVLR